MKENEAVDNERIVKSNIHPSKISSIVNKSSNHIVEEKNKK